MWSGDATAKQRGPAVEPQPVPSDAPNAASLVYIGIGSDWLPYLLGALKVMLHPAYWDTASPTTLTQVQCWVQQLLQIASEAPGFPFPLFILDTDGTFIYSLDGGVTSTTLLKFASTPLTAPLAWTDPDSYISNVAPFPYLWNGPGGVNIRNH